VSFFFSTRGERAFRFSFLIRLSSGNRKTGAKDVKSTSFSSRTIPKETVTREMIPSTPKQANPDSKGSRSNWVSPNTWMGHGQVKSESRCCVDCGVKVD
jgi:hypothetical protein